MSDMENPTSIVTPLLPRAELGLALAGGAARGLYHIGVIQALQEAGIRPDWYSGTSAGSIVAAPIAAGVSIEKLRDIAGKLTWNKSVLGVRRSAWELFSTMSSFMFKSFERMPPGFFDNSRIKRTIDEAVGYRKFSDLAPLIVTATDVVTGEEILFASPTVARHLADRVPARRSDEADWERVYGPHYVVSPTEDVGMAVRCSTCIPGAMTTVKIDCWDMNNRLSSRLVNDGGIVDLVPVRPLRMAGCRKVLAVFLGLLPRSPDARHWAGVGANSVNYLAGEQLTNSLRSADHVIYDPSIEQVSLVKIDPELIDRGYEFTRARIPEIRKALGLDVVSAAA